MNGAPIALMTPMANPTVEREMRQLLPDSCDYVVGRLVSAARDSAKRLIDYSENLRASLDQFGGMQVSSIAFACTASSYLVGREREEELASACGLPVMWAAAEIRSRLAALGASRIAVISPYPDPIHLAGLGYWRDAGIEIAFERRLEIGSADTRAIYRLTGAEADSAVKEAIGAMPDVILLSGTGMPTRALLDESGSPPVISSNYCLAQAMLRQNGESA